MQVGWVKIGDFRHISGYISKTVCALSNGGIADDLECPLTTSFSAFRTASFVTAEARDFKFYTRVGQVKY